MRRVFIAGINGNMGRHYAAILKLLQVEAIGCDPYCADTIEAGMPICDGVIIATPTTTHIELIREFVRYGKPILCEKPFTTSLAELDKFHREFGGYADIISMVNQYEFLASPAYEGETYYNYFKTGGDGLEWDCLNIIGLSQGQVHVDNSSAIWTCMINGKKLDLAEIDISYISMIRRWIGGKWKNYEYALSAHEKVARYIEENKRSHRSASTLDEHAATR